jgi:hypothetical protein
LSLGSAIKQQAGSVGSLRILRGARVSPRSSDTTSNTGLQPEMAVPSFLQRQEFEAQDPTLSRVAPKAAILVVPNMQSGS